MCSDGACLRRASTSLSFLFWPPLPSPLRRTQGTDFDRTGSLMTGTLARLDGLVRNAGGSSHMCRLVLFVVALFLALWFLVGRTRT